MTDEPIDAALDWILIEQEINFDEIIEKLQESDMDPERVKVALRKMGEWGYRYGVAKTNALRDDPAGA